MDPASVKQGSQDAVARAEVARAAVSVGPVETEYLSIGRGAPVVILDPELALAAEEGRIPDSLRGARVIVPVFLRTTIAALTSPTREGGPAFDGWWRGFIDGLGLSGVTVVVPPALEADVRRLADASPGEIVRIIGR